GLRLGVTTLGRSRDVAATDRVSGGAARRLTPERLGDGRLLILTHRGAAGIGVDISAHPVDRAVHALTERLPAAARRRGSAEIESVGLLGGNLVVTGTVHGVAGRVARRGGLPGRGG